MQSFQNMIEEVTIEISKLRKSYKSENARNVITICVREGTQQNN